MMTTTYNPYDERRSSLEELQFGSYDEYLESDLWLSIRYRVLAAHPKCRACRCVKASVAHHGSYDIATMRGERLDTLVACCARCHTRAERMGKRIKDTRERLQAVTFLLLSGWSKTARKLTRQARRESARSGGAQVWSNSTTWTWAKPRGATTGSKGLIVVEPARKRLVGALLRTPNPTPRLVARAKESQP